MGRTFEAIERAEREYKKLVRQAGVGPQERYYLAPQDKASKQNGNGHLRPDRLGSLKTKILTRYTGKAINMKTILVTGAAQGCGTSTTAVNLATALADDGRSGVLMVDANLKTPSLHHFFKTDSFKGMSELLDVRGEKSFGFKKIGDNELYLFPCGIKRSKSDGYFESQRFEQFLNNVRNSFDYIIFDSAPIPGFPDTQILCSKVDGVILVITYDKTRRQVAMRADPNPDQEDSDEDGVGDACDSCPNDLDNDAERFKASDSKN
jgi:capsular exopolysaccharide synthesis family protein